MGGRVGSTAFMVGATRYFGTGIRNVRRQHRRVTKRATSEVSTSKNTCSCASCLRRYKHAVRKNGPALEYCAVLRSTISSPIIRKHTLGRRSGGRHASHDPSLEMTTGSARVKNKMSVFSKS